MGRADEAAEGTVPVEAALEQLDAPAEGAARLPVAAAPAVERGRDVAVVEGRIAGQVCATEEIEEGGMVGQRPRGGELQPPQRHMGGREIHGEDRARPLREIGKHVATARGDGHQPVPGADGEGRHVHRRILPDLRIDEAVEEAREHPLHQSFGAEKRRAVHGGADLAGNRRGGQVGEGELRHWNISEMAAAPSTPFRQRERDGRGRIGGRSACRCLASSVGG